MYYSNTSQHSEDDLNFSALSSNNSEIVALSSVVELINSMIELNEFQILTVSVKRIDQTGINNLLKLFPQRIHKYNIYRIHINNDFS